MTSVITSSTSRAPGLPLPLAQRLLDRLNLQFAARMSDLYAGLKRDVIEAEWARDLAGYLPSEIARGLDECSNRKFPPTIGEFKQLCRPALDAEYAWQEAQEGLLARTRGELGAWSHPAVWRAAVAMSYDLRNSSFRLQRLRWSRLLSQELEKGWGDNVPLVSTRVEHRPTLTPMPAAIRKQLQELTLHFRGAMHK
jgi:hypothetical protein